MENIKDLKLIIGPLNAEQWKEVTAWCDETSICGYKFAKANINPTIFVRYTYHHTDQDNYYDEEYSSHEKLTYQQWYDRFIKKSRVLPERWAVKANTDNYGILQEQFNKLIGRFPIDIEKRSYYHFPPCQGCCTSAYVESNYTEISFDQFQRLVLKNVKQNKEEIMNNKQNFSISGTTVLKKAFVEEVGLPTLSEQSIDYNLTAHIISGKPALQGDSRVVSSKKILFNLPQDWTKALEYVKEYFKEEPKFKVRDYIYVQDNGLNNTCHNEYKNSVRKGDIFKIHHFAPSTNSDFNVAVGNNGECAYIEEYKEGFRLATPQEILDVLVKKSGFKVGDIIISTDKEYRIKGIIKKFYIDVYITKDSDDKFLYVTLEDDKSYVTTNFYGVPQFKLYNPTKTLVVGDQKIKVEISRKNIVADGKSMRVAELYRILGVMNTTTVLDGTSWVISYPSVKIGCTTLSLDEVKLIKKTYEELND